MSMPSILKSNSQKSARLGTSALASLSAGFATAFLLLLAGCGSEKPMKYYQVSYPTKIEASQSPAINTTLMVKPFEASHLYLDDRMVYGFDSPEMGMYTYERWSEPPVEILQNALVRGLRATGQYKAVYTIRADVSGRFLVAGQIYDFKEVDSANVVARLSYEIRLRDRKSGITVWEHVYSHDEPAAEKTVSAFVEAMDKNLQRSVQEVSSGLDEYFRAHPVEP